MSHRPASTENVNQAYESFRERMLEHLQGMADDGYQLEVSHRDEDSFRTIVAMESQRIAFETNLQPRGAPDPSTTNPYMSIRYCRPGADEVRQVYFAIQDPGRPANTLWLNRDRTNGPHGSEAFADDLASALRTHLASLYSP